MKVFRGAICEKFRAKSLQKFVRVFRFKFFFQNKFHRTKINSESIWKIIFGDQEEEEGRRYKFINNCFVDIYARFIFSGIQRHIQRNKH